MLWEAELKTLAGRKQLLATESDLLRLDVVVGLQQVAHKLRWVDRAQRVVGTVRPVLLWGASFLGFRRTSMRGRLLRALGAGFALFRGGRRLVRRLRG